MTRAVDNANPDPSAGGRATWAVAAALALAFWCTEHNPWVSAQEMYGTTTEDLVGGASGGKLTNQIGFSLIGVLGVALLAGPGRRFRPAGLLAVLILGFVGWCAASAAWSIDPPRTAKRVGILLLCLAGGLGVARRLAPREVCRVVLALTAGYAAVGLACEVALGTFRPWAADYRFAGTMHPNGQGANCALLCLAALCLYPTVGPRTRSWLLAALVFGGGLLVLTKSRTACAALVAGLLAVRCSRPTAGMVVAAAVAAWGTATAALVASLSGADVGELATNTLLLGRTEHAGTLTGRTELWEELGFYAEARPAIGYGYGSFWTPRHIEDVSETVFWGLDSAHSVYLEATLSVGLIGAGLLAAAVLAGIARGAGEYRATGDPGGALVFALLVYGLVDGVAESNFLLPSFITFVAGYGLCRLAFFSQNDDAGPGRPSDGG